MRANKQYLRWLLLVALLIGARISTRTAAAQTSELSQRYVLFLDGIATSDPPNPVGDFAGIKQHLQGNGVMKFVYFSYGAAAGHDVGDEYCAGWGLMGCSATRQGDLASLDVPPVYDKDATHLSIDEQINALEWLLQQIVSHDRNAKIDMVSYSLGGVVATRWAAQRGDSSGLKDHIHSLVLIDSPVGGIPLAGPILAGCGIDLGCIAWQTKIRDLFGEPVLRQLQLPVDELSRSQSIIESLPNASHLFPVTSIQSTLDYVVNDKEIPLCREAVAVCIGSPVNTFVGRGSQYWVLSPQVLHQDDLGGSALPTSPQSVPAAVDIILRNHGAPLSSKQTWSWVLEAIRANPSVSTPPSTPTQAFTTVFTIDVSGSMDDPVGGGSDTKLDGAKRAAKTIVAQLQQENDAHQSTQAAGLVAFDSTVVKQVAPASDFGQIGQAIDSLSAGAQTDIYDAIDAATQQSGGGPAGAQRVVILLTDGLQNHPPHSTDEFLSGPVAHAKQAGVKICTIGLGDDADTALLDAIANATGCKSYTAKTAAELQNVYIEANASATRNILKRFNGDIGQGQTLDLDPVPVDDASAQLNISLSYPGSVVELRVTDPVGTPVTGGYPGASVGTTATSANVVVDKPKPGDWKVQLFGQQVSQPREPYFVLASARPGPVTPPQTPPTQTAGSPPSSEGPAIAISFGVLALIGGLVLAVALRRSGGGTGLVLVGPPGVRLPLRDGAYLIGRDGDCHLRLGDEQVSRHHARVTVYGENVQVEDLGSANGSYVNGARIRTAALGPNDFLMVGDTPLQLQTDRGDA
jgi:Mg-chelatase subunit ChlD